MESIPGLAELAWVVLVAAIAPILIGLLPSPRPPEVVILLIGGIVIGPFVLDRVPSTEPIDLIVNLGLGFLFFVAGSEIDVRILNEKPGRIAMAAWAVSIVAALVLSHFATVAGIVKGQIPVAIALTTTALGTLLPIIKDNGVLRSPLGRYVIASGAVGEFAPLLAITLFLGTTGLAGALIALAIVGVVAGATLLLPRRTSDRIRAIIERGQDTSSQTLLRWTVVLLLLLLVVSMRFGLDIVIGAFAAGIVLRLHQQYHVGRGEMADEDAEQGDLARKIQGMAFGFFIPVFFVASGVSLDMASILENPRRLIAFFLAMAIVRGLPTFLLHRRVVPSLPDRVRLSLYTATGLPVIIAITTIGVETGVMYPENAAALVGAGVLTVLFFPLGAELIGRRWGVGPARPEPESAGSDRTVTG